MLNNCSLKKFHEQNFHVKHFFKYDQFTSSTCLDSTFKKAISEILKIFNKLYGENIYNHISTTSLATFNLFSI